tara:strand:+ start:1041 stop:1178 length:138 start_codon:yes stop_codon:yes gene_type:complete
VHYFNRDKKYKLNLLSREEFPPLNDLGGIGQAVGLFLEIIKYGKT